MRARITAHSTAAAAGSAAETTRTRAAKPDLDIPYGGLGGLAHASALRRRNAVEHRVHVG
jgi:hypothetical protein